MQDHDGHQPVAVEHGGDDKAPGLAQGGPVELEVRHPVVVDVLAAPERPHRLRQVAGGVGTLFEAGPQGGVGLVAEEDLEGVRVDQQDVLGAEPAQDIPKPLVGVRHLAPVSCRICARRQGLGARIGPRRRDQIGRLGAPSRVGGWQEILRLHRRVDPPAEGRREVAGVEGRHGGPGRCIRRRIAQGPVAGPEIGADPADFRQAGEGKDLVPRSLEKGRYQLHPGGLDALELGQGRGFQGAAGAGIAQARHHARRGQEQEQDEGNEPGLEAELTHGWRSG